VATVEIGEPLAAVERAKAGVARTFLLTGAVALLIAGIGGWVVASRTSRPLRRIARTAAEIDSGRLGLRIRARGPRDEVRVLADALDRMLDRLEDAFARQRGFVSDASHELRTPLTVVRGQLEVLARQSDPTQEDIRRVEGLVRLELLRMQRLVEDLLLLARADEGQLVRPLPLDADTFLADLWDGLSITAPRDFRFERPPGGTLMADPDRIAQVITNLVRNAVAHTREGGLVRLVARPQARGLEIAVEDDGPGIPPDQRARIFDRFHRIDAGRTRDSGGAGLGLAIAKAIVEAHGGTISAGVSPAGGARVAFVLPDWTRGESRSVVRDVPVVGRQR
jgi:signal transduction histidine kinase